MFTGPQLPCRCAISYDETLLIEEYCMQTMRFDFGFWSGGAAAVLFFCCSIFPASAQTTNDQYGLAAGHYERQEYELAVEAFRDLIEEYPSTRKAAISYFFLGESLVQLGDYQAAYPAYEIFLNRLPQDEYATRAKFRLAECAYRLNLDSQAVTLLEDFVQNYSDNRLVDYAITYLGELRLKRDEPQLALKVLQSALQQYPNSENTPRNRFGLARALQATGQHAQAFKFYEILTQDESNSYYGRAKMQIGVLQFAAGDFSSSQKNLKTAVKSLTGSGHLPEAKFWLAKCEMARKNYELALDEFKDSIEIVNNDELKVAMLFDGAVSAAKAGEPKIAVAWLNQLRKTWPDTSWSDNALQMSIELNYQQGNLEESLSSIAQFESEFSDHDNLPLITEYKGRIQYDQQEYVQSVKTFDSLITKHARDSAAGHPIDRWLYLRGLGELGLQHFAKATETFSSLDTNGKDNEFVGSVLLAEASCAVGMDKPKRAIEFFEQYLATGPSGSSADRARSDLAIAHARTGNWQTCQKILNEFKSGYSDADLYLETKLLVGEIALKNKQFAYAQACFKELASASNPRTFVVRGLSGLAWVRVSQGDEKSAVAVFQQLVKEHGESSFAAEAAMASGKYFEQHDRHANAVDMYRHVLANFSKASFVPMAKLRLSYNLVKSGSTSDLQEAEKILVDYRKNETEFLDEATYQLAWVYQDTARLNQSAALFGTIVNDYQDSVYWPDAVYRVAQQSIADRNYEQAAAAIAKVKNTELSADLQNRFNFLDAQVAVHNKDWSDVEITMLKILATTDDGSLRLKARYWLAESLFQLESYKKSQTEFQRMIEQPDAISKNRLAWANLRNAQCSTQLEQWPEAMDQAVSGKNRFVDFDAAYEFDFVIGRCHAAQGRLTEARKSYRSVIESPNGRSTQTAAMAQWRIGETFFHQEKYERAIEAYYRVDSLYAYDKWRAAALVEAGKCQEHLGNWNHAIKLYQQLIKKFPQSEFKIAAEKRMNLATRQATRTFNRTQK